MNLGRSALLLSVSLLALACSTAEVPVDDAATAPAEQTTCKPGDAACTAVLQQKAAEETAAKATDGKKDAAESDVDCGGPGEIPRCADDKACTAGTDCVSQVCGAGKCLAPRGDDTVKNGDESDVDCGGANETTARCAVGKACKVHTDCASDGCGYDGKCALARSCAGHFGGDTCGSGEVGDPDAKHESCCEAAPISDDGDATLLDKYVVTAGRMRQFAERMKGDLRSFGESLGDDNPDWQPEWNEMLPSSTEELNFVLGPTGHGDARRGCDLTDARGRTYWMSDAENDALGDGHHAFTKNILDQKALNCVEFFTLQAFCIWDGGRLATQEEIQTAWQGGESRAYPWGSGFDANKVVYMSNYQVPEIYDQGNFIYVAAPGRKPEGNGKFGHADLAGLLFELTSNITGNTVTWSGSGSWEGHAVSANGAKFTDTDITRAYWALGGRCARPTK